MLKRGIPNLEQILQESQQKFDERIERLKTAFKNYLQNKNNEIEKNNLKSYLILNIFEKKQENLKNLSLRLESVSVESVLKRGFAWIKDSKHNTIYSATQAQKSNNLEICFADGSIKTKVLVKKNEIQGDLFDM